MKCINSKEKHPWDLNETEKKQIEFSILPCVCGGKYKFDLTPCCPNCHKDLSALLPGRIYYLKIGNYIDGDIINIWKDCVGVAS